MESITHRHHEELRRLRELYERQANHTESEGGLEKVPEQGNEKQRVETPDGYQVAVNDDNTVQVYDPNGELVASIVGNRVWEAQSGEFFNFGDDSSFILPDGTKISVDLESTGGNRDRIAAVDITSGDDRLHVGDNGIDGITQDGREFDAANRDAAPGNESGVFALQDNGEFAVLERDGEFYDVRALRPSLPNFLNDDTRVRSDLSSPASGITQRQHRALDGAANTEEFGELLDTLSELLDKLEALLEGAEETGGSSGNGEIEDLLKQLLGALIQRTEGSSTPDGELTEVLEKLLEALQQGPGGADGGEDSVRPSRPPRINPSTTPPGP